MTGLDKILNCIDDDASVAAEKIICEAKLQAENIIEKAKLDADSQASLIVKDAENKAEFIIKRAASLADLKKNEMILNFKREQINLILEETKKFLISLPDDDYFNLILKLCKKYISPLKGEIIFSPSDLKRIPRGFKTNLSKLAKSIGGDLKISEQTRPINGGFILSYGEIEENCTFDALFDYNFELLADSINNVMFS